MNKSENIIRLYSNKKKMIQFNIKLSLAIHALAAAIWIYCSTPADSPSVITAT